MSISYNCVVRIPIFNILALPPFQTDIFEKSEQWHIEPVRGKQFQPMGLDFVFTIFSAIYQQEYDHYIVELYIEESDELEVWETTPEHIQLLLKAGFVRKHKENKDDRPSPFTINPPLNGGHSQKKGDKPFHLSETFLHGTPPTAPAIRPRSRRED